MSVSEPFVDIHCHLIPSVDDGAANEEVSLAMARMAVGDGISTIVATPHQLGNYRQNRGDMIRRRAGELAEFLDRNGVALRVLPGADVRIEDDMLDLVRSGEVLTLGDHGRHVLLELPHELYFPLGGLLDRMARDGLVGILSHPERNAGLLADPSRIEPLVDAGCLMQLTAGSVVGTFGAKSQRFSEWAIARGLVHFVSTDAHSHRSRRPLLERAFWRVAALSDKATALDLCCRNGACVADGRDVPRGRRTVRTPSLWSRIFRRRPAA